MLRHISVVMDEMEKRNDAWGEIIRRWKAENHDREDKEETKPNEKTQ